MRYASFCVEKDIVVRIKVLELPGYAQWTEYFEGEIAERPGYYNETKPVFHRNGLYLATYDLEEAINRLAKINNQVEGYVDLHNDCWMEYADGTRAVAYDESQFRFELALLNARVLSDKERDAIITIKRARLCSKELWGAYTMDDLRRQISYQRIEGRLWRYRWDKINAREDENQRPELDA